MRVLITGGAGFIGTLLAEHLVRIGSIELQGREPRRISRITLFDSVEGEPGRPGWPGSRDPRVELINGKQGDLSDKQALARAAEGAELVWHLAAAVSAEAEADFDLGMRANLQGTLNLLETLRSSRARPRLVAASSLAVYGGELPAVVGEATALNPRTSYGTQKAIGELLVSDYHRKGFVDGRSLRIPTITVRPGKPNKAASTFVSSIIREPLVKKTAVCPVSPESTLYVSSPRRVLDAMMRAMILEDAAVGPDRSLLLPGLTVQVSEMVAALERVAGNAVASMIRWERDSAIQRIIDGWPSRLEASRAQALGFEADRDFESIVRAHIEDQGISPWWLP